MIVAVDLDNVVAETDPKIREIIHRISGISLSQDDIKVFEYAKALSIKGVDLATAREIEKEALRIFHDKECVQVGLVNGAKEGVTHLVGAGFVVVIVTSRPSGTDKLTTAWLTKSEIAFEELVFAEDKTRKAQAGDFLVEDASHHAEAACKIGVRVCLLDYPWNRSMAHHPLIYRVKDWGEVVDRVLHLSQPRRG